jgi:hypothetical protein
MRMLSTLVAIALVAGCAKIDNPTAPTRATTGTPSTTTPTPAIADTVSFRVFGQTLFAATTIKTIDPVNGLTLTSSSLPYAASVTSTDTDAFLYVEASSFGASTATLQVQIFVNGKLFRESASTGPVLFAQASGTFRH